MFATVLIFSAYNINTLVADVDSVLFDLDGMNDIFAEEDDLGVLFIRLQQECGGKIPEYEAGPPALCGQYANERKDS